MHDFCNGITHFTNKQGQKEEKYQPHFYQGKGQKKGIGFFVAMVYFILHAEKHPQYQDEIEKIDAPKWKIKIGFGEKKENQIKMHGKQKQ